MPAKGPFIIYYLRQPAECARPQPTSSFSGKKRMPRHRPRSPYCVACRLRSPLCVCADAPHLNVATRLVLIMHSKEWGSLTNTGHLTRLALRNVEIRLHGVPHQAVRCEGLAPSTLVLFPGERSDPLTREYLSTLPRPLTLLVPDGNWNQAKSMMRRVPMLREARPVRLDAPSLGFRSLRRNSNDERRSTFEAIAQTLGVLEGRETESRLLHFFRQVLERRRSSNFL